MVARCFGVVARVLLFCEDILMFYAVANVLMFVCTAMQVLRHCYSLMQLLCVL